ncbi:MAG: D-aminoacyl-tRNA deacylase [Brooklawnia sp.]|jgi:D-tyrosyl-tRNA(Tyr) deacylase
MRVVLQRASRARVSVDGRVTGEFTRPGLVALAGITHDDDLGVVQRMAERTWGLRIFEPASEGGAELSASDLGAPILVVSQFTLYANTRKGRRPSWNAAAPGDVSEPLVAAYVAALAGLGAETSAGVFGAHMHVELVNDGPVTIILDSADWAQPRSVS